MSPLQAVLLLIMSAGGLCRGLRSPLHGDRGGRLPCRLGTMKTLAVLGIATLVAGCNAEQALVINAKANKPLSSKLIEAIASKEMDALSPILVRIFKQEAELEVWKQDKTGKFALLATFPICRWSGELGPKIKEGDRQAPEGFYSVTPAQMNPESQLYLSFNLGFPNAFDRSFGRTGSHLMVHGDCTSSGCYAMTDEQMSDIYALAREAFFGGQQSFQVQAYPFRMTPHNLAKHRASPHIAFWKMLKQGSDYFEMSQLEPTVDVCERRYVFGATRKSDHDVGRCPAGVMGEVASAISKKQAHDEVRVAELVQQGVPVITPATGIDGGMHALFAAKTPSGSTGHSDARSTALAATTPVPAVPAPVSPPRPPMPAASLGQSIFSGVETDGRLQARNTPAPAADGPGIFSKLGHRLGILEAPKDIRNDKAGTAKSKNAARPADTPAK